MVTPLGSVSELRGPVRRARLAHILDSMTTMRESFLRRVSSSAGQVSAALPPVRVSNLVTTRTPVEVFLSCVPADDELCSEFERHLTPLKRHGLIRTWSSRGVEAGEDWRTVARDRLQNAHLIVLLVSADYFASDYCWHDEMMVALARDERGEAKIIPVLLRACDLSGHLERLTMFPDDGEAVHGRSNRDYAWANVVRGIRAAAERLQDVRD